MIVEKMTNLSKKENKRQYRCPTCKSILKFSRNFAEKKKCKKCDNFFFFVKIPEKFFVLE